MAFLRTFEDISSLEECITDSLPELVSMPFEDYNFKRSLDSINIAEELESLKDLGLESYIRRNGNDFRKPERQVLAGRVAYKCLLELCPKTTGEYVEEMGLRLRQEIAECFLANADKIDQESLILNEKLIKFHDWFSIASIIESYLVKDKYEGRVIETPVQMHFRVAIELYHTESFDRVLEMVRDTTMHYYSLASPAYFNSGLRRSNLSSCFLMQTEDSLESIFRCIYDTAMISRDKGGIGIDASDIRSSSIGFDGQSSGIMGIEKLIDHTINYVNQTGRRSGAATMNIQPNILDFVKAVESVKKTGDHSSRVMRLNMAIFASNLFWDRVRNKGTWTCFCPKLTPGLNDAIGEEYDRLYLEYEADKSITYRETYQARDLVDLICNVQMQAGMPYILYKDAVNMKSNQVNMRLVRMTPEERKAEGVAEDDPHLITIRTSNLCLEIFEQTHKGEIACCNLGQMSLPSFVKADFSFDFESFGEKVRSIVAHLDRVIDVSRYPKEEARLSNTRHRPIGLGVSGYADMMSMMGFPYESLSASIHNKKVFACMYFNALVASIDLARAFGSYPTFKHSPASEGRLQFDLWEEEYYWLKERGTLSEDVRKHEDDIPIDPLEWGQQTVVLGGLEYPPSWKDLKSMVVEYGLRNSQLIALMPSASTSRIMRNSEAVDPHVLFGTRSFTKTIFAIVDRQLYCRLNERGYWNDDIIDLIQADGGSVSKLLNYLIDTGAVDPQDQERIDDIKEIQSLHKSAFEISMKTAFKYHAERSRYICQSSSLNCYMAEPTSVKLLAFHLFTFLSGLKTGMYYLRQTPASAAPKTTLDQKIIEYVEHKNKELGTTSIPKACPLKRPMESGCAECEG